MHIYLSVEWTLVMHYVLYIRNVQSSCRNISAHKNNTVINNIRASQVYCLSFQLQYSISKPIEVLQSLSLLHFTVQATVFDF